VLDGLEVEMNVNAGSSTLNVDYDGTFDVVSYGRHVRIFNVPASQVMGRGAVLSGTLRQRGSDIESSGNPIPPK
jgi:hypothetical protein